LTTVLGPRGAPRQQCVLPLVEVDDASSAVAVARVLVDGGLAVMEIVLRTPGALASIEAVRSSVPDAVVGVGTIMVLAQLSDALPRRRSR
jgi:2-dehydro-3-deoxyphosphogluconate aldolase/(4S)-4-hydroxy-2-oxoglutarate aldolase